MKHKLILSVIVLTILFATTSFSFAASTLDYIKVGLKYAGNAVAQCKITADDGLGVASYTESGFSNLIPLNVTAVNVTNEDGTIVVADESGNVVHANLDSNQAIVPLGYESGGVIKYDNVPYRGGMLLKASVGKIVIINYIQIENYVYGVLAAEIGASAPMEAIKAQAVAARSFAGASVGSHNSNGFDLCSTTHCQMYKGVAGETTNTNKGTDETRGEMIYSEGKPVNAYYAKNAGGHTQNSEDVWYAKLPYLRGVKDTYAPDYLWTATMTFSELKSKLESSGYKPGEIKSVSVKKRSEAGAVYTLEIVGSDGVVTLQKDSVRTVLGGTNIKSLMFNFVDADLSASGGTDGFAYVVSVNGTKTKIATNAIYVSNGTATAKWADGVENSGGTGNNIETVTNGVLNIKGNGYGHGIGMQQDGAIAMAKQGILYKEILKFYYTGIEIK